MTFGERLKELRSKNKWSQDQLSELSGFSHQVISNYERDYRQPDFEGLITLSTLFNVTIDYLLKGDETEKIETFGSRLRELRKTNELTVKKLADNLKISPRMVTFLETNDREPNLEMIVKIAKLFKVTTDYLLGYEVEK